MEAWISPFVVPSTALYRVIILRGQVHTLGASKPHIAEHAQRCFTVDFTLLGALVRKFINKVCKPMVLIPLQFPQDFKIEVQVKSTVSALCGMLMYIMYFQFQTMHPLKNLRSTQILQLCG